MNVFQIPQGFDAGLVKAIKDYHMVHRDTHVTPVRFVTDPQGDSMVLVRCIDEQGNPVSCLMAYYHDRINDTWDVTEATGFPRELENDYVQSEMQNACDDESTVWVYPGKKSE